MFASVYSKFIRQVTFGLIANRSGYQNLVQHLDFLNQSQYWGTRRLQSYQQNKIKKLLIHAFETTSYYRELFRENQFDPYRFNNLTDLACLPLLSKEIIRSQINELISNRYRPDQLHMSETGGTTGVKMQFYRDNQCLGAKEAALFRFEQWSGWSIGDRVGIVWPARQDYLGHWTLKAKIKNELYNRQVVFPAAVMEDAEIQAYLRLLNRKKPAAIRAFTSPIYEIAKYVDRHKPALPKLRGIITTGEPLYAHQRTAIEEAFKCKVFDSYRSREGGPIAQECEAHDGLHINAESLFVEVLPSSDPGYRSAKIGEIVITDLLNFGMPLIRYRMGDLGQIIHESCTCGRGLPRLKNIRGRTSDIFHSPNGKKIAPGSLVLYLVDEAPGLIGQVQIVQDRLNHILIRITKEPRPTKELLDYQKRTVSDLFGAEMEVSFEFVDNIPREKSGKYLFAKCLVKTKN